MAMTRTKEETKGTNVPLLDLRLQYQSIREEVRLAVERVLDSQHFILGPEVTALEGEIARYCQCEFAVGLSSGTDALLASLMAIGVAPGDEIITSAFSFFATAGSIARAGAKPVFVDIDPHTFTISAHGFAKAINAHTRAIIPVHLYGQTADMGPLLDIARKRNLMVIEDAAQAIGADYKGHRVGSLGDVGCLSFYPTKNLGAYGDGGMVTTGDREMADHIKRLRGHGEDRKYFHVEIGGNFRLDELQAAVLRVKMKYLDAWTEARQANATAYRRLFAEAGCVAGVEGNHGFVHLPEEAPDRRHVYNQFVIRCERRDELRSFLLERGIGTEVYYPVPLHLQPCFAFLGHRVGDFPESERAAEQTLALPIYPELQIEQQEIVVRAVSEFFG
jgi:dTDP-4-amino-4,6-dideoxygalactose transaminase